MRAAEQLGESDEGAANVHALLEGNGASNDLEQIWETSTCQEKC